MLSCKTAHQYLSARPMAGCSGLSKHLRERRKRMPGEIASHSSGKVCGDRDGGEGRQSRQDLPSGAASVCLLGGGVSGKTYSSFPYLPSKFIFVHYRRYSINSEWTEENLESGSLFLISSVPVHALQSCRCKNTSQGCSNFWFYEQAIRPLYQSQALY